MKTIKVTARYDQVLLWLMENVGPMLHSQPIIFWHGEGWHMQHIGITLGTRKSSVANQQGQSISATPTLEIKFDDDQAAIWCALIWA